MTLAQIFNVQSALLVWSGLMLSQGALYCVECTLRRLCYTAHAQEHSLPTALVPTRTHRYPESTHCHWTCASPPRSSTVTWCSSFCAPHQPGSPPLPSVWPITFARLIVAFVSLFFCVPALLPNHQTKRPVFFSRSFSLFYLTIVCFSVFSTIPPKHSNHCRYLPPARPITNL